MVVDKLSTSLLEDLAEGIAEVRKERPSKPTVSVVIPALNEADNLPLVIPSIDSHVHEVILVDGQSEDDTIQIASRLNPRIRVLHQDGSGKGDALRAGFAAATGDIIVALDADGSADPGQIPAFIGALCAGADFAKGSRFMQGAGTSDMPLLRRLGNRGLVLLVRSLFGGRYSDLCYGYNAFWRDVLPRLDLHCDGFEIETLMNIRALRARLKVVEVASFEAARVHGTPKLRTFPDGWRVLKTIVGERLRRERAGRIESQTSSPTLSVASAKAHAGDGGAG
jgi:glycosyltransferase involved in cell wall biosynthesis